MWRTGVPKMPRAALGAPQRAAIRNRLQSKARKGNETDDRRTYHHTHVSYRGRRGLDLLSGDQLDVGAGSASALQPDTKGGSRGQRWLRLWDVRRDLLRGLRYGQAG